MAQQAPALDFEALLAREFRPSNITRLVPREKYQQPDVSAELDDNDSKKETKPKPKQHPNPLSVSSRRQEEAASLLVHSLITQTPAYRRHAQQQENGGAAAEPNNTVYIHFAVPVPKKQPLPPIPREFHEIQAGDWESKICYDGVPRPQHGPVDPLALLETPRNHHLDNVDFMEAVAPHTRQDFLRKAQSVPLTLELGVAGQSVAHTVYSTMAAQRPPAAHQSEAYKRRKEHKTSNNTTNAATAAKSLQSQKDEKMAEYEARQEKRAQMAEDKKSRVSEAMAGTNALVGGGRGRTITSSLMGPGGTERTGRPSRTVNSSFHEVEHIEQLDMVNQHTLVRSDWSKILLRQHLRPKLPLSVVRPGLVWQIQHRYIPAAKKAEPSGGGAFHSIPHAGAVSKERLRTEADLSPTEGKLILLEYSEERPPIQMTKGMCSKIVNYYRGDRARCPVSAGGGDRPSRRKRGGETSETPTSKAESTEAHLKIEDSNVLDWVGKLPKKSQKDRAEQEAIDVMPEGVTEILHNKVHGPFIGPIKEGQTVTGLVSNIFVAPLFLQPPKTTDFLMILTQPGGASRAGRRETMGVVLRDLPSSTFTVGQTEPRTKVHAPHSQGEKMFMSLFTMFQIGRHLTKNKAGMTLEELKARVMPNIEVPQNSLRQRLKAVAVFDKPSNIWTLKPFEFENFQGFEALKSQVEPEGVAAFEAEHAARCRLKDLGIEQLVEKGTLSVISTGVIMVYLSGQLTATREIYKKVKKYCEHVKGISKSQVRMYDRARDELEMLYKTLEKRHEVAQFIYEELQLAPWNITKDFIDVHINGEGSGMMRLTGLGDPTGKLGEGFSFIRALDTKPIKSVGTTIAVTDKISGTQNDLRKLSMEEMREILRDYGMTQKKIDTLKRWDRVHCIRDFSTRAASDGIGDGLERFARGEKMKLSDQKLEYTKRIEMISERQRAALSATGTGGPDGDGGPAGDEAGIGSAKKSGANEESEPESDADSFFAEITEDLKGRTETNQILASQAKGGEGRSLNELRAVTQDQNQSGDARAYASFQREEKKAQEARDHLKSMKASETIRSDRKVIRRRITRTHPDGRQTTTFKYVLNPDEVGRIMDRLQQDGAENARKHVPPFNYERGEEEKPPGHAMFEDEDDFEYSPKGRVTSNGRRRDKKRRGTGRNANRNNKDLQFGKFKQKANTEERARKRKKEEEELEVYSASAKRKGTNNRKERGSIRERRPHVIFAEKLESIRQAAEAKDEAAAFRKPVSRKHLPRYYETISHPIDFSTIRAKIADGGKYKTANELLDEFELMKKNAIKFNGEEHYISNNARMICDFVKQQIELNREELSSLEAAISDYWSTGGNPTKKQKTSKAKQKVKFEGKNEVANLDGVTVDGVKVNLGNIGDDTGFGDSDDTDSE